MKHRSLKYVVEIIAVYFLIVVASWAQLEWANAKYEKEYNDRIYRATSTSAHEYVEYHGGVSFRQSHFNSGSDMDMISHGVEIKKAPIRLDWHDVVRCDTGEGYEYYFALDSSAVYSDTRAPRDSLWSLRTPDGEKATFPNEPGECFNVTAMTVDKGMAEGLPPGTITEIVIMQSKVVLIGGGL